MEKSVVVELYLMMLVFGSDSIRVIAHRNWKSRFFSQLQISNG